MTIPSDETSRWRSFVALGDSFTEGMCDDVGSDGRHIGWADRTAQGLAETQRSSVNYANLAVRGRLIPQVASEQVPAALALNPDLVSVAAGVNDVMRRHFSVDATATALESCVRQLRTAGSDVLIFSFGNPARRAGMMSLVAGRMAAYRSATLAIAATYDAYVVDFWDVAAFDDDSQWDTDRLHLSPLGHQRASWAALNALGLADDSWRTPGVPSPRPGLTQRVSSHATWAAGYAAPWLARRVKGTSSGDGIKPKGAEYRAVHPL